MAAFAQTSRVGHRRREQVGTGSREHEGGELATDFRRPCPDRFDYEGRVARTSPQRLFRRDPPNQHAKGDFRSPRRLGSRRFQLIMIAHYESTVTS